jgi:hypothetical protein
MGAGPMAVVGGMGAPPSAAAVIAAAERMMAEAP